MWRFQNPKTKEKAGTILKATNKSLPIDKDLEKAKKDQEELGEERKTEYKNKHEKAQHVETPTLKQQQQ